MHEFSLIRALLRQVDDIRRTSKAARVLRIRLSVGEFAGVMPELLESAFQQSVVGTDLADTRLECSTVPLAARCDCCASEFRVERFRFSCPFCDHDRVTILRGENILLEAVTVDDGEVDET